MATNGTARRSKQEYLQTIYSLYRQAGRTEKQTMLDECTAVCGYHRKYAIWLLNHPLPAGFKGQGACLMMIEIRLWLFHAPPRLTNSVSCT
jgi:hypothetical protein